MTNKFTDIKYLIFDLDNTLYPPETGLLQNVSNNISKFIEKKLRLSEKEANILREKYKEKYGITLSGLIKHHGIDFNEFDKFVYNINYESKLKKDNNLYNILKRINLKKIIYTNSGEIHSLKVLKQLGLDNLFDDVITIEKLNFLAKPTKESITYFLKLTSVKPKNSLFFEDSETNLFAAEQFGFKTAIVGKQTKNFDFSIKKITDIQNFFL
jgi:putative hydrolase of the HAD superfamily